MTPSVETIIETGEDLAEAKVLAEMVERAQKKNLPLDGVFLNYLVNRKEFKDSPELAANEAIYYWE